MNLGKLLGAGKSFISGRKPAAYRADKRFYLPQFVSPKNPFASPVATATQAELPKSASPDSVPPATNNPPIGMKTKKMPVMPVPAAPVTSPAATARKTNWVSKLNPVSMFRSESTAPNRVASAVQVELSLEKVKVVHNDLTDADVEIVPMKSRPARLAPASPSDKKSWADLGERIMKATAL